MGSSNGFKWLRIGMYPKQIFPLCPCGGGCNIPLEDEDEFRRRQAISPSTGRAAPLRRREVDKFPSEDKVPTEDKVHIEDKAPIEDTFPSEEEDKDTSPEDESPR